jgi:hypothetical protein
MSMQEEWVDESLMMAVWGSRSLGTSLAALCAVLCIQCTSPTWQWSSTRFDTHLNGARLLGTNNHFLAIRDVHLNTKQHISNVHYTSLQPLLWLLAGWLRCQSSSPDRFKNFLSSKLSRPALGSTKPIQWVPGALSPVLKRPEREADHSPLPSAFMAQRLIH